MHIAENLRRMRRERDLTQEELANFLGVSFQAVSKWERGDGYPDITFLPALANFFETTVDDLLGMDEMRDKAEIEKILAENYAMSSEGKSEERIALLRDALKRFPHSHELWLPLAAALTFIFHADDETKERNRNEAIEIYERILARCTIGWIRNNAQTALCYLYDEAGQREKAAKIAKSLPGVGNCNLIRVDFMEGGERRIEIRNNILHLANELDGQVFRLREDDGIPSGEKIEMFKRSIAILRQVFDDGELYHLAVNIGERYQDLAREYMKLGDTEAAIDALEQSVPYAIAYDNQPETAEYQSVMLRGLKFERANYGKDYPEPWCYWVVKVLEKPEFDPARENPRFIAVIDELRRHTG